jgi:hypothetical protein
MIKLIHSASFDPIVGAGAEIIKRSGELTKQASTIFGVDYDALKPDDKSVGIHVVALGDAEHYGQNRNGDLFPKEACVKYHDTFVKHGHVYRHHKNKDPEKSIGIIKASAYNEPMGRVELFIHADKEKAAPELERLEKEGEIPVSMACCVSHDRCSICGAMRKQAGDSSECEHVANHLGEQWDDGRKVGTYNDHPRFFDISFVGRPADRIAWNLKVASALELDSVKAAEYEGVEVPDSIACDTAVSQRKLAYLKDINTLQQSYKGWLSKQASVVSTRDRYLMEFTKVATVSLDNETISRLREQPITNAMGALASHGIIMDLESFLKYATGDSYSDVVAPYVPAVKYNLHNIINQRIKQANCASICIDTTYDVPAPDSYTRLKLVPEKLNNMLKKQAFDIQEKIIDATIAGNTQNTKLVIVTPSKLLYNNDKVIEKLAETYLSYQLSAIDAVVNGCRSISKLDAEALASVSNLKQ